MNIEDISNIDYKTPPKQSLSNHTS